MKIEELRLKKEDMLLKTLAESREKLRALRFELSAGKVKDVRAIRQTRKNIAKILTILKQKKDE